MTDIQLDKTRQVKIIVDLFYVVVAKIKHLEVLKTVETFHLSYMVLAYLVSLVLRLSTFKFLDKAPEFRCSILLILLF